MVESAAAGGVALRAKRGVRDARFQNGAPVAAVACFVLPPRLAVAHGMASGQEAGGGGDGLGGAGVLRVQAEIGRTGAWC